MARIRDVAAYFCENYPHKDELSKTRLTKLVYLADWESSKQRGHQVTPIKWYFHNFGPYVDDVMGAVQADPDFRLVSSVNYYGDQKTVISLADKAKIGKISDPERQILDGVIETTSPMHWDSFIKHVYSTAPIVRSERYAHLDLGEFAKTEGLPRAQ